MEKFRGRVVDDDPSPWLVDCWKVKGRACEEFDESRDELWLWAADDDDDDDKDDVWRSWIDLWSIELLEEDDEDEDAKETGLLQLESKRNV